MDYRTLKVLLMDVDGVLTDGSILLDASGNEMKCFNVLDGLGIKCLQRGGIRTALITGRSSIAVTTRAQNLSIELRDGVKDKLPVYQELIKKFGVRDDEVGYIGDDLPDIPVLKTVAFPFAVANSRPEIKDIAQYTAQNEGGKGAVREIAELILKSQGKWEHILRRFEP